MNIALNMMDFVLKMMDFVLKMMDCVLKMTHFVTKNDGFCINIGPILELNSPNSFVLFNAICATVPHSKRRICIQKPMDFATRREQPFRFRAKWSPRIQTERGVKNKRPPTCSAVSLAAGKP